MRDLMPGSERSRDDVPLGPAVTRRAGGDGHEREAGEMVPPYFRGSSANPSVSENDFWDSIEAESTGAPEPQQAQAAQDDIPDDAFYIPEGADHVPAGINPQAAQHAEHVRGSESEAFEIADRLEAVARRLRAEGASSVSGKLVGGDSLDNLLAGLLAGYIASRGNH